MSLSKSTPLISVGRSALLAVIAWAFLSAFLWFMAQEIPPFEAIHDFLLQQPVNLLTNLGIGIAIGGFATSLLLKSEQMVKLSTLWLLVVSVTIAMLLYDYFPIGFYRLLAVKYNLLSLTGLVIGVFFTSRGHWLKS